MIAERLAAAKAGCRPAVTKVRCPKCRSRNLHLHETSEATLTFIVTDGRLDRDEGWQEPGNITGVYAECSSCQHGWTVRGAAQIDSVVTEIEKSDG